MNVDFRSKVAVSLACLLLIFCTTYALGQGVVTGSISGTVVDPQGAVIVGAKVTATNPATNQSASDVSSSAGAFSLRQLPPGIYNMTITAPNFQTLSVKGIEVKVGVDTALGAQAMKVGAATETVTVEATAPLVESTTPQLSTTYEAKQVTDLPIGSAFDELVLLVPGAATAGDAAFSNTNGASISMNGQRGRSNNFQIDGQSNNDNSVAGPSLFLSNNDVIAEYQVISNNFSAEYGRNMGSVINYITKSGSNTLHGSAFWFYTGSWLSSRANQDKSPLFGFCIPPATSASTGGACSDPHVPRFIENKVGGTIGGRIKKDKAWFFASYLRDWQRSGATPANSGTAVTPTPAGIATLLAAFPGNPGILNLNTFGPFALTGGNPGVTPGTQTVICVTPDPTGGVPCVPVEFGGVTRFLPNAFNDNELTGRIDVQITPKDRFFGRYIYQDNKLVNGGGGQGSSTANGGIVSVPARDQQIGLDWVRTWTDHFINQVRFSFSRAFFEFGDGPTMPFCTTSGILDCPALSQLGGDSVNIGQGRNLPQGRLINVTQFQDNASWVHGRHTIKFGGEYDRQRSPNVFLPIINGWFQFTTYPDAECAGFNGMVLPTDPTFGTACAFDNYLANLPSTFSLTDGPTSFNFKEQDAALYVQDSWRWKDNLTINFGVRWEWDQQAINLLHDLTVARETGPSPFWLTTLPLSRRTVPFTPQDMNNFGPVIGFAYTPRIWPGLFGKDKTVIRGGFRIAYDPEFYNMFLNVATAAPVVNAGTVGATFGVGACPTVPAFCAPGLPVGFPATGAGERAAGYLAFIPTGVDPGLRNQTQVSSDFHNPYAMQWNFGVQRELASRIAVEVNYVGNHTVGNFQTVNANPNIGPPAGPGLFHDFPTLLPAGVAPCLTVGEPGFNTHPNCNNRLVRRRDNGAWSIYHALQADLRIQNWHGWTSGLAWTWSHAIDNVSEIFSTGGAGVGVAGSMDPFNPNVPERGTSGTSYTHVVALWWVYELPWYKSQAGFIGKALGGWQVNGIYQYHSGQPFNPLSGSGLSRYCDATFNSAFFGIDTCRPVLNDPTAPIDMVGRFNAFPACTLIGYAGGVAPFHWIRNDSTAALCLGNPFLGVGRNGFRAQTFNNLDMGIFKNFKMGDRLTMQIQANSFNILNRQFRGTPDPFIEDGGFSTVQGSFMNTFFNGSGNRSFQFALKFIF